MEVLCAEGGETPVYGMADDILCTEGTEVSREGKLAGDRDGIATGW